MQTKYLIHVIILTFSCLLFTSNASAVAFNDWGRWASGIQKTGPSGCDDDNTGDACNQDETLLERDIIEDDAADTLYALALFFTGLDEFDLDEEELDGLKDLFLDEEFLFEIIFGFLLEDDGFVGFLIEEIGLGIDTEKGTFTFEQLEIGEEEFVTLLMASLPTGFSSGELSTGALELVDLFFDGDEEVEVEGIEENATFIPLEGGEFHTFGFFAFVENNAIGVGPFVEGTPTDNMSDLMAGEVFAFYEGFGFGFGTEGVAEWGFNIAVSFGDAEWEGEFGAEGACAVCGFGAGGDIFGTDFSSNFIEGEGEVTGFVEGTFFGPDAAELGGRFEVSNDVGTDMAVFSGFQCEGECSD